MAIAPKTRDEVEEDGVIMVVNGSVKMP